MKQQLIRFMALAAVAAVLAAPRPAKAQARTISTGLTNIVAASSGGRVLNVTSTLDNDPDFSAKNLIDGQIFNPVNNTGSKGWASNKFDPINMESVTLGFKDNNLHKIGRLVLNPATNVAPERWAKDIEVQVSTDSAEGPYTAVAQLTLRRSPIPQAFPILPADARFVRLVFRSNWGSDRAVALGEVEIYEAIDTSDPLGELINRLEGAVNELHNYRKTQIDASNAGGQVLTATPASFDPSAFSPATVQMIQMMDSDAGRFPVSNQNIAAAKNGGRVLAYSSTYDNDPAYGPDKLIDGQNFSITDGKGSFGWSSEGFEPGKQYVTLGFKDDRIKLVGKVVLNPASNQSDLRWARRIDLQVTSGSFKDGPWRTVATFNLKSEPTNQDFLIRPVEAKYVRLVFQANGPGILLPNADPNVNSDRAVSLGEVEIYEAVSSGDQLVALIGKFDQILLDLKTLRERQVQAANAQANAGFDSAPPAAAPAAKVAPVAAKPAPKAATPNTDLSPTVLAPQVSPKPPVRATPAKGSGPRIRSKAEIAVRPAQTIS